MTGVAWSALIGKNVSRRPEKWAVPVVELKAKEAGSHGVKEVG